MLTSVVAGIFLLYAFTFRDVCDSLLYFKEGASTTMTSYNEDGEVTGSTKTVYSDVSRTGAEASVSAAQENFDKKGKKVSGTEFVIRCAGGTLFFDMKMMVPSQQQEAYQDMEMTVEGADMETPGNLVVGSTLQDANLKMSVVPKGANSMPIPGMSFAIKITNRKVEAKETVTTAAGTFECYKITEDVEMTTMFVIKMKSVNWFNFDVGSVKTESYKENGKYMGKTELTAMNM